MKDDDCIVKMIITDRQLHDSYRIPIAVFDKLKDFLDTEEEYPLQASQF
ncbi:4356_t:CDS:2 [Funneliformis geosporum]|uniref:4356_t:CDS:1 n=1 Tax=Funneliformis geosporum TaxID=1117311 RepID=A0A9W4WU88_9GLOM|nr:4356_t:CDS:2 [Funneliformis geosporum]